MYILSTKSVILDIPELERKNVLNYFPGESVGGWPRFLYDENSNSRKEKRQKVVKVQNK